MLSFENDYSSTAAPQIVARMQAMANEQNSGYGKDQYCDAAANKIRKACDAAQADVWFLVGGTQTNQTVLSAITPQYAGVVCPTSAHINTHEAGAIEATGHKVLALPQHDGKITGEQLDEYCQSFENDRNHEHMVYPGCVYISQPTEYGTVYTREELASISQVAHDHNLPLYVDGARLGMALTADMNDVQLPDLARLADVFTIGGTKCGTMFGEAVVFPRGNSPRNFTTIVKQHGALLAKGWLLGLQFDTLFTDDLYFKLAKHANAEADKIRKALFEKHYDVEYISQTNQIFIVVATQRAQELAKSVKLGFMEQVDADHVMLRICTSWATTDEQVDELIKLL
ncbi:threonine aldolase family protein [Bifidobacterium animalis]|uniref:threonine aldolase family protein n=1 Tax=Bifidobacterium animalis TaxID=28025 RepID=UPI00069C84FF|nr:aminotransferase class I/II-fold pyridoxal phosphate-dependent enzyme [Bifidobacterium animalis]